MPRREDLVMVDTLRGKCTRRSNLFQVHTTCWSATRLLVFKRSLQEIPSFFDGLMFPCQRNLLTPECAGNGQHSGREQT